MDNKVFNSNTQTDYLELIAPYYNAINPTKIFFEEERIYAYVDSLGHVEFYNATENSLGYVDVPVAKDPNDYAHSAQYGKVEIKASDDIITIHLPVYTWDDNYPHCDGESDRWDRRTIGCFDILFDCNAHKITVTDKQFL